MLNIKENVGKPKERLWKYCLSVKKLLWPFKWYIGFYLIYISLFVRELIAPLQKMILFLAQRQHPMIGAMKAKEFTLEV